MARAEQGQLTRRDGSKLSLTTLIGEGGEGRVYQVHGNHSLVAKIYKPSIRSAREKKIEAQVALQSSIVSEFAAWPIEPLYRRREFTGFLMNAVSGRQAVHELYGPKSRRDLFPKADFRFLVRVAANTARAFAALHSRGIIVGDVNQDLVRVGLDGTVKLIDCDSFQVEHQGTLYTCDVGVPLFTPPELQSRPLRGLRRAASHDSFGLASMVFHILFMGRHPFAGTFLGAGEMPIERAIAEGRFAFSQHSRALQMSSPPGSLPVTSFNNGIALAFEASFSRQAVARGERPTASEWLRLLKELEGSLTQCRSNRLHQYPRTQGHCLWCAVARKTGVDFFQNPNSLQPGPWKEFQSRSNAAKGVSGIMEETTRLERLMVQYGSVQFSRTDVKAATDRKLNIPEIQLPPSVGALSALSAFFFLAGFVGCATTGGSDTGAVIAFIGIGLGAMTAFALENTKNAHKEKLEKRERKIATHRLTRTQESLAASVKNASQLSRELQDFRTSWLAQMDRLQRKFKRTQAEVDKQVVDERRRYQREKYLDRFKISRAKIALVGELRKAALRSYGIETAADIDNLAQANIAGFGPQLRTNLAAWQRKHEAGFRFNKNTKSPKESAIVQRADRECEKVKLEMQRKLEAAGRHYKESSHHAQRISKSIRDAIAVCKGVSNK